MEDLTCIFSNDVDPEGNPTGGFVDGEGIAINWQEGPLGRGADRVKPNGAFVETVVRAVIQRIQFYQTAGDGRFCCRQNALAITKLEEGLHWLQDRTAEREARGVEGTHQP